MNQEMAIAAIGQMLVITTGRGAIDLSIPGVITLAAYPNVTFISSNEAMVLPGILIILLAGIVVGLLNSTLVVALRIPPMIATMAVSYILSTVSLLFNSAMGLEQLGLSKSLVAFARGRLLGINSIIFVAIVIAGIFALLMNRTTYGKSLQAIGQNYRAAYFAGIKVRSVEVLAYVFCGLLAAIAGLLISLRTGGAFLGMGDAYMLETVGGVVIGGTLISGGKASPFGTILGCLFLTLIVTAMQVARLDTGIQNIVKGLIIVAVIIIGTKPFDSKNV